MRSITAVKKPYTSILQSNHCLYLQILRIMSLRCMCASLRLEAVANLKQPVIAVKNGKGSSYLKMPPKSLPSGRGSSNAAASTTSSCKTVTFIIYLEFQGNTRCHKAHNTRTLNASRKSGTRRGGLTWREGRCRSSAMTSCILLPCGEMLSVVRPTKWMCL